MPLVWDTGVAVAQTATIRGNGGFKSGCRLENTTTHSTFVVPRFWRVAKNLGSFLLFIRKLVPAEV